jgi:cysteinyl-tRNA synthetase
LATTYENSEERVMPHKVTLYNSLGRREEEFVPIEEGRVRLYACGPTVYHYAHVGNLRTYVFEDILRRVLVRAGYEVCHVVNVTDVGHLTSDADDGDDKMLAGARRERRSVWEIARFYEAAFFDDLERLNVLRPHVVSRATEHVDDMLALVERIAAKGYAYEAGGNVYFDVGRFPSYGELARLRVEGQQAGLRVDVDEHKRDPNDFVLWFTQSKFPEQEMVWPSPWGVGFPGWHLECSAMAARYLGERIDIHCGGVDHIPVHHTNERAQSEAAFGHRWVNYWLHGEFLVLPGDGKMSKSTGEFVTLTNLAEQGFSPEDFRYLCLGAHYRSPLQFHTEALGGARNALSALRERYLSWDDAPGYAAGDIDVRYVAAFDEAVFHDLNLPRALAVVWAMARDTSLAPTAKRRLLVQFDGVLGLGVASWRRRELPLELRELVAARSAARRDRDFGRADAIRDLLRAAGVEIRDTPAGTEWSFG